MLIICAKSSRYFLYKITLEIDYIPALYADVLRVQISKRPNAHFVERDGRVQDPHSRRENDKKFERYRA